MLSILKHDAFSRNTRNQLKQVFDALRKLMTPPDPPKRPIGFVTPEDKGKKTTGRLARPDPNSACKVAARLAQAKLTPAGIVDDLRRLAIVVAPTSVSRVVPTDPDDDHVLAAALAGGSAANLAATAAFFNFVLLVGIDAPGGHAMPRTRNY